MDVKIQRTSETVTQMASMLEVLRLEALKTADTLDAWAEDMKNHAEGTCTMHFPGDFIQGSKDLSVAAVALRGLVASQTETEGGVE
jgi:hypothetical protein